jgi:hypothetical protein
VIVQHPVKDAGEPVAEAAPSPDLSKSKLRWPREIAEVLMSDRVSPLVQLLELLLKSMFVQGIVTFDVIPERLNQSAEVRADTSGLRIPTNQLTVPLQLRLDDRLQVRRIDQTNQQIGAFGIKITAEALEVRHEQHHVSLVDLLGRIPPAAARDPDRAVRVLDPVQFASPDPSPLLISLRRHLRIPIRPAIDSPDYIMNRLARPEESGLNLHPHS